jgi:hypothetical protein
VGFDPRSLSGAWRSVCFSSALVAATISADGSGRRPRAAGASQRRTLEVRGAGTRRRVLRGARRV